MIHFSNKKFGFTIFIFLFLLCCTQEETNFHKQDNEKKEIESFFEISQIKSRSDNKHNDLVDIIKQCLLKQENIIGAIRFYKERYGTPPLATCYNSVNRIWLSNLHPCIQTK